MQVARFTLVAGETEYADAPTLDDAVCGAKVIAGEEDREITVLHPSGIACAWAQPDGRVIRLQGGPR